MVDLQTPGWHGYSLSSRRKPERLVERAFASASSNLTSAV